MLTRSGRPESAMSWTYKYVRISERPLYLAEPLSISTRATGATTCKRVKIENSNSMGGQENVILGTIINSTGSRDAALHHEAGSRDRGSTDYVISTRGLVGGRSKQDERNYVQY
jgi:hypothetical protein